MNKTIAIIKGDGIGPEIVTEAMGVLDAVAAKFGHTFTYVDAPMGGNAIDKFGVPLPDSSLSTCRNARRDAVEAFKKAQKEGMPEDESKDGETQSQKLLEKFSKTLDEALSKKEKEIMTV